MNIKQKIKNLTWNNLINQLQDILLNFKNNEPLEEILILDSENQQEHKLEVKNNTFLIDGVAPLGQKGDKGDTGVQGPKGDAIDSIIYDSLTESQKQEVANRLDVSGVVASGNLKAVNGGEVYNNSIRKNKDIFNIDNTDLGYYALNGVKAELRASSTTRCAVYDLTNVIDVTIIGVNSGDVARAWAFSDSENNILSRATSTEIVTETKKLTIPNGATKLFTNTLFNLKPEFLELYKVDIYKPQEIRFSNLEAIVNKNKSDIYNIYNETLNISSFVDGYYDLTGTVPSELKSSTSTKTAVFNVENTDFVELSNIYGQSVARAYGFVNDKNVIIQVSPVNDRFMYRKVTKPLGAVKIYVSTSNANASYPYDKVKVILNKGGYNIIKGIEDLNNKENSLFVPLRPTLPKRYDGYTGTPKTYSLAGTDVGINGNKYFTKGYLFTEFPMNNGKVFYGNSINDTPVEICNFNVTDGLYRQYAISPKHRTIVSAVYDDTVGNNYKVFENGSYADITFTNPAYGWLYNFGHYFGTDENNNEYLLIGEYSHSEAGSRRIFKATYPYSNQANWRVVHEIMSPEIHHIHQVIKDPFTNALYCFTGDTYSESNIYKSTNEGDTWTLFARSTDIGTGTKAVLRATNVHFLEDKCVFATDDDYHVLVSIGRGLDGFIDISKLEILATLKSGQMTNGSYYDYVTDRLYMMDRVRDITSTLESYCYDFKTSKLVYLYSIKQSSNSNNPLWGHRGRAYIVHSNNSDGVFGFGISLRIRLQLGFAENNMGVYGGLYYKF